MVGVWFLPFGQDAFDDDVGDGLDVAGVGAEDGGEALRGVAGLGGRQVPHRRRHHTRAQVQVVDGTTRRL